MIQKYYLLHQLNWYIIGYLQEGKNIYTIIPELEKIDKYKNKFEIIEGELVYIGENDNEKGWVLEAGGTTLSDTPEITTAINVNKVKAGVDIEYTLNITCSKEMQEPTFSNSNIKVINGQGVELSTQPNITSSITGTAYRKTAKIIITTTDISVGIYKIKILSGAVQTLEGKSNNEIISNGSFEISNEEIIKPTITASPISPTQGNVTLTLSGQPDETYKIEYSYDGTSYQEYTTELNVTNNLTLYARMVDSKNNKSEIETFFVTNIDREVPQIIFETNGGNNVEEASTKVTYSDVGTSGVSNAQYVWSTNSTEPASGWLNFNTGDILTYASEGTYYLWVKVTDRAGNVSNVKSNSFVIVDLTPPDAPILTADPTSWTKGNVSVTITYSSDIQTKQYSTNGTTWNTYTASITMSENGTVYARGYDSSGNVSEVQSLIITNIDKTLPVAGTMTMKLGSVAGSTYTDNTWTNQSVYLAPVNGTDIDSGHGSTTYTVSGANTVASTSSETTITNSGTSTVIVTTTDTVGNSATRAYTVKIDKTVPVVGTMTMKLGSSSGSAYTDNTWTNQSVYLAPVNGTDIDSGHGSTTYTVSGANTVASTSSATTIINSGTSTVTVTTTDTVGNSATRTYTVKIDKTIPTVPTITPNTTAWTNQDITVTITYSADSYIKEYSLDGVNWSTYTSAITVNANNTTVYARAYDEASNTSTNSITIANIDKTLPENATINLTTTSDTISGTITLLDNISGISLSNSKYLVTTQSTVYTTEATEWSTATIFTTNPQSISATKTDGDYYVQVLSVDNAGNKKVNVSSKITVANSNVNPPDLEWGMSPVRWTGTEWMTISETDSLWYNYDSKQWANMVSRNSAGDINTYWVWIPRYEYKITTPNSSTAQTIEINFVKGTSTTPTSGYKIHPAFTFGSIELKGIWVAKFEASGDTSGIDILPDQYAITNTTISQMFTACSYIGTAAAERYRWFPTGIDTHLMKNIEWGAVAYLTQSIYGKNSEVWINPDSIYRTGRAGTSVSASSTINTYEYKNTTYGVQASTTGNIYGVYDMSRRCI